MANPPEPKTLADIVIGAIGTAGIVGGLYTLIAKFRGAKATEKVAQTNADAQVIQTVMTQCVSLLNTLIGSVRDMHNEKDADTALAQLQDNIDHWQTQAAQAYDETITLIREKTSLAKQVEELTKEVKQLHVENEEIKSENAQLKAENVEFRAELASLRAEMEVLRRRK